jgi:hypothetical protein
MDRKLALLCAVYALLCAAVLMAYSVYGVGWDFIAHYLSAKALLSGGLLDAAKSAISSNSTSMNFGIIEGRSLYFEFYRAPLSIVVIALFLPLLGTFSIEAYLVAMVLLLLFAVVIVADALEIERLVLGSLIALPYIVAFPFMVNSEEMLSLSLMLIAIALAARKKWQAGAVLGLAALSKYTALIFLPVPLFIGDTKKTAAAYIAFAIVTLPWLAFNYSVLGNPLYSYLSSIRVSVESTLPSAPSLIALSAILSGFIPAVLIAVSLAVKYAGEHGLAKRTGAALGKFRYFRGKPMLVALFFLLACIEFAILGMHEDTFDQARYGYFLFAAVALLLSYAITALCSNNGKLLFAAGAILLCFSIASLSAGIAFSEAHTGMGISGGSADVQFYSAASAISSLGMKNCSFISNAWVFLRYRNISAYSPYAPMHVGTEALMPAVVFDGIGTAPSAVPIYVGESAHSYNGFTIYTPHGGAC